MPDRRDLYWRCEAAEPVAGGVAFRTGTTLSFDTYFNSFFESHWRRHTTVGPVTVAVDIEGEALLQVHRRALGRKVLIHRQAIRPGRSAVTLPDTAINFRQHGVLSVELVAQTDAVVLKGGGWSGELPSRADIGLAAVFCTFNRERDLAGCLDAITADAAVTDRLARVIVVNQGEPDLRRAPVLARARERLGRKLVVIEQPNRGGAGGFTRGLLAALDDPAVTHAVLLDDDIQIEPGSLIRLAEFFAAAKRDLVVGGHMLDLLQPTILYEAGAEITAHDWGFRPHHHGVEIGSADALEELSRPSAVHYNGWWCCGLPLALLRRHGLPLPCFIRGDDVELGLRLHKLGIPTVPMPGIAVWHEPFYLKLGDWQLYYETRNMLVAMALHAPASRLGTLRRVGRQILRTLLTYRYYRAALILDGLRDFLAGPGMLHGDPLPLHTALAARKTEHPPLATARELVLTPQQPGRAPRAPAAKACLLVWLLVRNALAPTPAGDPSVIAMSDIDWTCMTGVDHAVLDTWWDERRPTLRRSREEHRALLRRAIPLLWRLFRDGPAAASVWRGAAPTLTSEPFWRGYLGLQAGGDHAGVRMAAE